MNAGHFKKNKTALLIAALCLCIVAGAAGGVYAYITAQTGPLSNEFSPAKVSCAVEESFEDGIKENVQIRNTGNVDAYIRAVVVVTFVSQDGKVLSATPKEGTDYTVAWGPSGWLKGTDGFWYHKSAVAPDALTAPLILTAAAVSVPEGYRLNIRVVATAVQAAPENSVKDAWGINVSNGELVPH